LQAEDKLIGERSVAVYILLEVPLPKTRGSGSGLGGGEKGKDMVLSKINEDKMKKKEENIVQEKKE
jgi:hypothetical protein